MWHVKRQKQLQSTIFFSYHIGQLDSQLLILSYLVPTHLQGGSKKVSRTIPKVCSLREADWKLGKYLPSYQSTSLREHTLGVVLETILYWETVNSPHPTPQFGQIGLLFYGLQKRRFARRQKHRYRRNVTSYHFLGYFNFHQ